MNPVLDLRDARAFLQGHSPSSVNIPLSELRSRMYELPEKGAALQLFHDDPPKLQQAIELLTARGYQVTAAAGLSLTATGRARDRLWSPSPLLEEAIAFATNPGRALDLACGSGREAVHLASLGWQVDAVDSLPDALQNASILAERHGTAIRTIQRDLRKQGIPPTGPYDLITVFRFWHRPLIPAVLAAISPGGLLVIEVFHPDDPFSRRGSKVATAEDLVHEATGFTAEVSRVRQRNGRTFSQLIAIRG